MSDIIGEFKVQDYTGKELERLGENINELVLRHIGMKRYERSGIKVYDISAKELGELIDGVIAINKGVEVEKGEKEYQRNLRGLLNTVGGLKGERVRDSVVHSLKTSVVEELKLFRRENIMLEDLWEI